VYCTAADSSPDENVIQTGKNALSVPALLHIIEQLHGTLQLETIRLTGGEPLLYAGLLEVIKGIRNMGIENIRLTTNGFLLARMAGSLKKAGMKSINVSLDAVEEQTFFLMSKRNKASQVLQGIDAALEAGLDVKINSVIMKGINDSQVIPLLDYAFKRNIIIRYLEVMAMGHLHKQSARYFVSQHDILLEIAACYDFFPLARKSSATSNYWQTDEGHVFGIIANESEPFCHDCNRLRMDSNGNIYGCLSDNQPISLMDVNGEAELQQKLYQALTQKQTVKFTGSELSMLDIGG
jgi:cyclic pyranopterin phosphate synthase